MTDTVFTLTIKDVQVLPNLGALANVATKVMYEWTAVRGDEEPLSMPGVQELGEADPDYFTDLATLSAAEIQDVVGGWVMLEMGREKIRLTKANMNAILNARVSATVPFALPES